MSAILRLGVALARASAAHAARRAAATSGLFALALFFAAIGFTGFAAAFWIWLSHVLDPISASLLIGGAGFVLAAILLLVARSQTRKPGLFASPEAQRLLDEFRETETGAAAIWVPLIGAVVLGVLMGGKARR